jgi:flavin reductase (DIM6/NTAB) family NADH-FMN oxidoreductase RutF
VTGVEREVAQTFRDAMAGLTSGVAVVTGRRPDGDPCGLVVTSASSFSAEPPSVLVSVAHTSRCHEALTEGEEFGLNVLASGQARVAEVFAGLGDDKFAGVDWSWHDGVPRIAGTLSFLCCRRSALFEMYDHTVLVGDVIGGSANGGDPLVYLERSMGWRLEPGG